MCSLSPDNFYLFINSKQKKKKTEAKHGNEEQR